MLDKILTLNHLKSRCWNLTNRCVLCLRDKESIDRLQIQCPWVKKIWVSSFSQNSLGFPKLVQRASLWLVA